METFTLALMLAVYAFTLAVLGRRLGAIDPIVLVLGGLLLSVLPFMPVLTLNPELVLAVFLPPVLYQAALHLSWRELRANLRTILLLAVGLVIFTAVAVAGVASLIIPGMTLAAGMVLGAIVSPPDAVAATAVLSHLRVPRRLVTILEGESLINDATALVFYAFAVEAVVNGHFVAFDALKEFLWVAFGGVAIGLIIGKITVNIHRRMEDPTLEVMLSLTVPFVVFLTAEHYETSGVLAVVAAGLLRAAYSPRVMSAATRLQVASMWEIIVFVLNAIGFLLIGSQLQTVISNLKGDYTVLQLATYGAAISLTVILVRFLWLYPVAWVPRAICRVLHEDNPIPTSGTLFVLSWSGMRGIVSLVAALALPTQVEPYGNFPARDMILFLTYITILVTLVGQGSTLGFFARRLGVEVHASDPTHARQARADLRAAGLKALQEASAGKSATARERLEVQYAQRLKRLKAHGSDEGVEDLIDQDAADYRALATIALKAERATLLELRNNGRIEDDLARELQQELDLHEILIGTERGVG